MGECLLIPAAGFQECLTTCPTLNELLGRWTETLIYLGAQTAACNRHHQVEQRLARWMLETIDRCKCNEFALTQGFLAAMLGVRRQQVNIVSKNFFRAGAVEYLNGEITVLNRAKLEKVSCECYRAGRELYSHVMGAD
jgi:hypothetical protein